MYKIAGEESRKNDFNLNAYLDKNKVVTQTPKTVFETHAGLLNLEKDKAADAARAAMQVAETKRKEVCDKSSSTYNAEKCKSYPMRWWHDSVDWEKLAAARNPAVTASAGKTKGQQMANEVFAAIILAGIVIFTMQGLLKVVSVMTADILGDFNATPDLYNKFGGMPGAQQRSQWASNLSGSIGTMISQRLGGKP
jgi:hypothetical protein